MNTFFIPFYFLLSFIYTFMPVFICLFFTLASCVIAYVLAARITHCILIFVKMQSDYFDRIGCAVPILRVLTMSLRGITDTKYH